MGGNALKDYGVVRVSSAVEARKAAEVISILSARMLEAGLELLPRKVIAYRDKADHGDIDLLVPDGLRDLMTPPQIAKLLSDHYGVEIPCAYHGLDEPDPTVIQKTSMISLGVPLEEGGRVQVDLIWVKDHELDYAEGYYAWNDLGNLMGVIGKKMGLKFGHKGLTMMVSLGNRYGGEVLISQDFKATVEFFGYDHARWARGFDNLEQIFEFAASSTKFDPDVYLYEFRSHNDRSKERRRTTYAGFLEYLRNNQVPSSGVVWKESRADYLEMIFEAFPEGKVAYQAVMDDLEQKLVRKARLNGELVHKVTGLDKEELGGFIKAFKLHHGEALEQQVLSKGEEVLVDSLRTFQRSWAASECTP
jgi:hypothetical protein